MDDTLFMLESKIEELLLKLREYRERCDTLEKENSELKEKLNGVISKIENLVKKLNDAGV
ncbi:MAG: hypothetical protein ABDH49_06005 [Candidatus Hydrothermales bacterium]